MVELLRTGAGMFGYGCLRLVFLGASAFCAFGIIM